MEELPQLAFYMEVEEMPLLRLKRGNGEEENDEEDFKTAKKERERVKWGGEGKDPIRSHFASKK